MPGALYLIKLRSEIYTQCCLPVRYWCQLVIRGNPLFDVLQMRTGYRHRLHEERKQMPILRLKTSKYSYLRNGSLRNLLTWWQLPCQTGSSWSTRNALKTRSLLQNGGIARYRILPEAKTGKNPTTICQQSAHPPLGELRASTGIQKVSVNGLFRGWGCLASTRRLEQTEFPKCVKQPPKVVRPG